MYHNKRFRDTAESHGLTVTRSERYGWSTTGPSDSLIEWILNVNIQEIRLNRYEPGGIRIAGGETAANGGAAASGERKDHSIRYRCPVCGQIARTTKAARLIGGDCMCLMEES